MQHTSKKITLKLYEIVETVSCTPNTLKGHRYLPLQVAE